MRSRQLIPFALLACTGGPIGWGFLGEALASAGEPEKPNATRGTQNSKEVAAWLDKFLAADSTQDLPIPILKAILQVHAETLGREVYGQAAKLLLAGQGLSDPEAIERELLVLKLHYNSVRENGDPLRDVASRRNPVTEVAVRAGYTSPRARALTEISERTLAAAAQEMLVPMNAKTLGEFTGAKWDGNAATFTKVERFLVKEAAQCFFKESFVHEAVDNLKELKAHPKKLEGRTASRRASAFAALQGHVARRRSPDEVKLIGSKPAKDGAQAVRQLGALPLLQDWNTKEFVRVLCGFHEKDNTPQRLDEKLASVKEIAQKVEAGQRDNRREIRGLSKQLYELAPLEQKVDWVRNKRVRLTPEERAQLKREIDVARKVEAAERMESFVESAGDVVKIAAGLGVDRKIVEAANVAVGVGGALAGAARKFAKGDILGAALSFFGSLFGLGGPDPDEERHKQVLACFERIGVELDYIRRLQMATLEKVLIIEEKLDRLTQTIERNHLQLMDELGRLRGDVSVNRSMIYELLGRDLNIIRRFLDMLDVEGYPYAFKERIFARFPTDYNEALGSLRLLMSTEKVRGERKIPELFLLRSLGGTADAGAYLEVTVKPVMQYFANRSNYAPNQREAISALATPRFRCEDIEIGRKPGGPRLEELQYSQFSELLIPHRLEVFAHLVLRIYPYLGLVNVAERSQKLVTQKELESPKAKADVAVLNKLGEDWLRYCLNLTDLAIAQQALLSGDLLLPELAEKLESPDVRALLKKNGVLARNVVAYWLRQRLKQNGVDLFTYEFATASADGTYLSMLTRQEEKRYDFERDEEGGWEIVLIDKLGKAELKIPLPDLDEVDGGALRTTPEMNVLLELRESLRDHLAQFEFKKNLTPRQKRTLTYLMLLG